MTTNREAEIQSLVDATIFRTSALVNWVFAWDQRTQLARVENWKLVSSDYEAARSFYDEISDDETYTRWCAAEVLVDAGWTFEAICRRKS